MADIFAVLIPILIVDAVNPVLFAFMVYAAGTERPVSNSSAILLGHTCAYFIVGIALALGLEQLTDRLENPQLIDYIIGFLIGVLLIGVAFRSPNKSQKQEEPSGTLTPIKALGLGAIVNFVGIPFALPYFAALDQILKADLAVIDSIMVLAAYNLFYALPFLIIPVLVKIIGKRSQSILGRINGIVERVSSYIMPILLALAGFVLVVDALKFMLTGKGLF
ncbi:GAP family protein [Marinobacterium jannaschii]|uniref:GAP family protein n=1 Tax=Marinobacterium jannaschii TaxID=64970 RepID=UPI000486525D|nr:GAP family protein [Marinobacterium jannaschii]